MIYSSKKLPWVILNGDFWGSQSDNLGLCCLRKDSEGWIGERMIYVLSYPRKMLYMY